MSGNVYIIIFDLCIFIVTALISSEDSTISNKVRLGAYLVAIGYMVLRQGLSLYRWSNRFFRSACIVAIWMAVVALTQSSEITGDAMNWRDLGFIFLIYILATQHWVFSAKKIVFATGLLGVFILLRPFVLSPESLTSFDLITGVSPWKAGNISYGIGTLAIANFFLGNYWLTAFGLAVTVLMSKRTMFAAILLALAIASLPTVRRLVVRYTRAVSLALLSGYAIMSLSLVMIFGQIMEYIGVSGRDRYYDVLDVVIASFTPSNYILGLGARGLNRLASVDEGLKDLGLQHAHNDFLNILIDYGIVGLLFWFVLCRNLFDGLPARVRNSFLAYFLCMGFSEQSFFAPSHLLVTCYVVGMFMDLARQQNAHAISNVEASSAAAPRETSRRTRRGPPRVPHA